MNVKRLAKTSIYMTWRVTADVTSAPRRNGGCEATNNTVESPIEDERPHTGEHRSFRMNMPPLRSSGLVLC